MTEVPFEWKDYEIIATGDGYKLERWGKYHLLRPDPQVIWEPPFDIKSYPKLDAYYLRSETGGGQWKMKNPLPDDWTIGYKDMRFKIKLMGFKHTGLFPEQAVNWERMTNLIKNAGRPISVLNLFAYTGGATVALSKAGASVCHVDASKGMVERAKENAQLSGAENIRYIIDDCIKFVTREIKRGKKYDAIVMDPPSYGRGPNGEMWKIENGLFPLVKLCTKVLSDNPLFFLINSYTTGLQPQVLNNILKIALKDYKGKIDSYEVGLNTKEGIVLPCGAGGLFYNE